MKINITQKDLFRAHESDKNIMNKEYIKMVLGKKNNYWLMLGKRIIWEPLEETK